MSELLIHFTVPFALTSPILGVKKALVVGFIALLPDVDALLHVHRSITHSLILTIIIAIPVVATVASIKPKLASLGVASFLAVLSHLVLDVFQTYTPILYPLTQQSIHVDVNGGVIIGSGLNPYIKADIHTTPTDFTPFTQLDAPIFTSEGLAISIMLIAIPILYTYIKHRVI